MQTSLIQRPTSNLSATAYQFHVGYLMINISEAVRITSEIFYGPTWILQTKLLFYTLLSTAFSVKFYNCDKEPTNFVSVLAYYE